MLKRSYSKTITYGSIILDFEDIKKIIELLKEKNKKKIYCNLNIIDQGEVSKNERMQDDEFIEILDLGNIKKIDSFLIRSGDYRDETRISIEYSSKIYSDGLKFNIVSSNKLKLSEFIELFKDIFCNQKSKNYLARNPFIVTPILFLMLLLLLYLLLPFFQIFEQSLVTYTPVIIFTTALVSFILAQTIIFLYPNVVLVQKNTKRGRVFCKDINFFFGVLFLELLGAVIDRII